MSGLDGAVLNKSHLYTIQGNEVLIYSKGDADTLKLEQNIHFSSPVESIHRAKGGDGVVVITNEEYVYLGGEPNDPWCSHIAEHKHDSPRSIDFDTLCLV